MHYIYNRDVTFTATASVNRWPKAQMLQKIVIIWAYASVVVVRVFSSFPNYNKYLKF